MLPQFSNSVNSSFLLWAEHKLLSKGLAYKNYTSRLYYTPDPYVANQGYRAYASPFKQWVYDLSISGAFICNGISGDISLNRGVSGLRIDYDNGRVLVPASFGTNLNISGTYAFKDLNFYLANETEDALLTNTKFFLNSRFNNFPTGGIAPYSQVTPAIFFNSLNNRQEDFALGGQYNSVENVSLVIMAENVWMLDAILSIYRDAKHDYFPQVTIYDHPLDEYGDVKSTLYPSGYSYLNLIGQYGTPGNLFLIESVRGSKVSDRIRISESLFVGLVDIEISKVRGKS